MQISKQDLHAIRDLLVTVLNHPKSWRATDTDEVRFPLKVRAVKILIFTLEQVIKMHDARTAK